MKKKIYKSGNSTYTIIEDGGAYTILRRLPFDEFIRYYMDRRDEIETIGYDKWLRLGTFDSHQEAEAHVKGKYIWATE